MPYYIFNFKKGDLSLEFESTDSNFVSKQIDKWIGEVTRQSPDKVAVKNPIKSQEIPSVIKKIIREQDIEVITNTPAPEKETVEELEKQVESALKATQNVINDTNVIKEYDEIKHTITQPDFENFDAKTPEIVGLVGEVQEISQEEKKEKVSALDVSEKAQNNKFYKILQEKFSSLPEIVQNNLENDLEHDVKKDNHADNTSIEEFVKMKNPRTPLDFLIVAAYYLKEYDLLDRYSLKQINSKIIKYIQKPINHSVIREAVANNFLEVVPDYTGMADVTEYIITSEGINYLINEMQ